MKTFNNKFSSVYLIAASFIALTIGCDTSNNDDPEPTEKTPVWTYNTNEDPSNSTPCVVNGKVFVCSYNYLTNNGNVHCISADNGQVVWKTPQTDFTPTSPVVFQDKVIYGGLGAHALNINDGSFEWDYTPEYMYFGSPAIKDNGVYFNGADFVKLDAASGNKFWDITDHYGGVTYGQPPVLKNGYVYYGTSLFGEVFCVNETSGTIIWSYQRLFGFLNSPAVSDESVFFGQNVPFDTINSLFCCNLDGITLKWEKKINLVSTNMLISGDKIYVAGLVTMYCLNTDDGSEIWKYSMSNGAADIATLTGNKLIVGTGNDLICLNANTGALIWSFESPGPRFGFSGATVFGDKVVASCADGYVYCFNID
jgi:outer membrane protein assembly factor BamB